MRVVLCLLLCLWLLCAPVQADIVSNLAACWGMNEGTGGRRDHRRHQRQWQYVHPWE